jgi:hypothetical protein
LPPAALSVGNGPAERMAIAVRHERVLSTVGTVVAALLGLTMLALALFTLLVRRRQRGRRIGVPVAVPALVTLALGRGSGGKPVTEITVRGCPTEGCYARTPRTAPRFISGTFRE